MLLKVVHVLIRSTKGGVEQCLEICEFYWIPLVCFMDVKIQMSLPYRNLSKEALENPVKNVENMRNVQKSMMTQQLKCLIKELK